MACCNNCWARDVVVGVAGAFAADAELCNQPVRGSELLLVLVLLAVLEVAVVVDSDFQNADSLLGNL